MYVTVDASVSEHEQGFCDASCQTDMDVYDISKRNTELER